MIFGRLVVALIDFNNFDYSSKNEGHSCLRVVLLIMFLGNKADAS